MKKTILVIAMVLAAPAAFAANGLHCDVIESIAGDFSSRPNQTMKYTVDSKIDAPGMQRVIAQGQLVKDFSIDATYAEQTPQSSGAVVLTVTGAPTKESPFGPTAVSDSTQEPARVMLSAFSPTANTTASIRLDCKIVTLP